jgi:tRNA-dihydrouridine synthase B
MKQFASWFTHGVPGGAGLRKAIYECKSGPAILESVEKFFEGRLTDDLSEVTAGETAEPEALECCY